MLVVVLVLDDWREEIRLSTLVLLVEYVKAREAPAA